MKIHETSLPWALVLLLLVALTTFLVNMPSMRRSETLDLRYAAAQEESEIYRAIWAEADARIRAATDAMDELKRQLAEERARREAAEARLRELTAE